MQAYVRLSRLLVILTVMSVIVLGVASRTFAAGESQHIALTPSSAELASDPGQSVASTLAVINQGDDNFRVAVSVAPYHVEGLDYDPQFTQLPGTVDASKWVHLQNTGTPTLTPHQLLHVDYNVQVPVGTPAGGYYAVIFAETTPTVAGSGVVAHNRVGEVLYLTVKGAVKTSGSATAGNLSHIYFSGNVAVDTLVRNTGGVHFKSTVTTTIKSMFGRQVFKQSAERYILPQTERKISIPWSNHAPFGLYHISRQATVPGSTIKLADKTIILVQPWLLIVLLVLVAVGVAALVRKWSVRPRNRK